MGRGRKLPIPDSWWDALFSGDIREVDLDVVGLTDLPFNSFVAAARREAANHNCMIVTRQWPSARTVYVQAYGPGTSSSAPAVSMCLRTGPMPEATNRQTMPSLKASQAEVEEQKLEELQAKILAEQAAYWAAHPRMRDQPEHQRSLIPPTSPYYQGEVSST